LYICTTLVGGRKNGTELEMFIVNGLWMCLQQRDIEWPDTVGT